MRELEVARQVASPRAQGTSIWGTGAWIGDWARSHQPGWGHAFPQEPCSQGADQGWLSNYTLSCN